MKLNEGYFLPSKYKDKEDIIDSAKQFMEVIFSDKFYKDMMFGLNRTKFRNMSTRKGNKEITSGFANTVDIDAFEYAAKKNKLDTADPKAYNQVRNKLYKRATKALGQQKIFFNKKFWGRKDETDKILLLVHEMIHVVQPYTADLKKTQEKIYRIFKESWKDKSKPFSLSKILLDSPDGTDEGLAGRVSEIIPYIISDGIYTKYITEEGTKKVIDCLKNSRLINPNDEFGFWDTRFENMIEDSKQ